MDFVSDALFNGKRIRSLTVVDAYTRECLAIHVDQGSTSSNQAGVQAAHDFFARDCPCIKCFAKVPLDELSSGLRPVGSEPIGNQEDVGSTR